LSAVDVCRRFNLKRRACVHLCLPLLFADRSLLCVDL
jgi:hypothetical protein